jgi:hypothetical protein
MAQDWSLPISGITVSSAIIDVIPKALETLRTVHSSATAPTNMVAYMLWADTSNGVLKIRNSANTAWIEVGSLTSRHDRRMFAFRYENLSATKQFFIIPKESMEVEDMVVTATVATSGSDASNHYRFDLYNQGAGVSLFSSLPTTNGDEVSALSAKVYTPDQNLTVSADELLIAKIEKIGTGPTTTDWTAAEVGLEVRAVGA